MRIINIPDIPLTDVIVEIRAVLKGVAHVRHRRRIPVPDVPIGGVGIGLVGEPEVDGGLEVGIIDYDIRTPVVCPVGVRGKGFVDVAFVGV